jgi:NADH:ubiquinone oxidoreductase subunit B-like Fe-S oxidoreductase
MIPPSEQFGLARCEIELSQVSMLRCDRIDPDSCAAEPSSTLFAPALREVYDRMNEPR